MASVLALDIGGTNCRMKIVDESGASRFRRVIPTAPNHPTATLDAIEATLQSAPDFDAVGVGVAGNVEDGVLTGSGNLPGWTGCHFEQAFAHLTGRPSVVLNDCAAAALGEYSSLQSELVYVIWGTGVGAASVRVVDGVARPLATELGHMVIDRTSDVQCGCGGYGHLEAFVGEANLSRRFDVTVAEMSDQQWNEVLVDMAVGLRNISLGNIGLPIVLGGGVALNQQHRLEQLQELTVRLVAPAQSPKLLLAAHGDGSGLVGATYAARQLLS